MSHKKISKKGDLPQVVDPARTGAGARHTGAAGTADVGGEAAGGGDALAPAPAGGAGTDNKKEQQGEKAAAAPAPAAQEEAARLRAAEKKPFRELRPTQTVTDLLAEGAGFQSAIDELEQHGHQSMLGNITVP